MEETGCEIICGAPMIPAVTWKMKGEWKKAKPQAGLHGSVENVQLLSSAGLVWLFFGGQ